MLKQLLKYFTISLFTSSEVLESKRFGEGQGLPAFVSTRVRLPLWALIYAGLQSEHLTEGRKGADAGFARKYMFLFSEQLGSWAIALKTNKQTMTCR